MSTAVTTPPAANGNAAAPSAKVDNSIRGWLRSDSMRSQIAQALPKHLTADRFVRVILTAITRTPKLMECDPASFFRCVLDLAQLGLEADGRRAHLIPFWNNKRQVTECQLIVDYKGIAELVMRSGLVSNLHADLVCENDDFEYDKGIITRHKIDFRKDRGKPYAVYAVCRMRDGTEKCDVMTLADVEAVRKRSKAANNGPWVTDFNEMAKKTVFRRLSKWIPWSAEIRNSIENDDDTIDDAPVLTGPSNVLLAEAESRSDQLADMLSRGIAQPPHDQTHPGEYEPQAITNETPPAHDDAPATEGVRLSDLALELEAALDVPTLTKAENLARKQQVIDLLSQDMLQTGEAAHLQRIVERNAARFSLSHEGK